MEIEPGITALILIEAYIESISIATPMKKDEDIGRRYTADNLTNPNRNRPGDLSL